MMVSSIACELAGQRSCGNVNFLGVGEVEDVEIKKRI
jgi:hypothetical protein